MKAIEAAKEAYRLHQPMEGSMEAAIAAYLTALAEDEAAVERIAMEVYYVKPLPNWTEGQNGQPVPWENLHSDEIKLRCRAQARAAIRAMGGE